MRGITWIALGAALGLVPAEACAEPAGLAQGREHWENARFDAAERAFDSVVRDGASTREDLAEAYRHLAALLSSRGDEQEARRAAQRAASLDVESEPPEGAPAAARALFAEARTRAGTGLACTVRIDGARATVGVSGDPGELATSAALACGPFETSGALEREHGGRAFADLAVPAGAERCDARVLAGSGALLARASAEVVADRAAPAAALTPESAQPSDDGSRGGVPWLWVGVGAGVVAAAVIGGLLLSSEPEDAQISSTRVVEPE